MANQNYVSCIKINSVPIIPPLLSPEISSKCLEYKQKALELEKLYSERKSTHDQNHIPSYKYVPYQNGEVLSNEENNSHCDDSTKNTNRLKLNQTSDNEINEYNVKPNEIKRETPRLIRSNSYTLDNPSPILLAHIEKENSSSSSQQTVYPNVESLRDFSALSELHKDDSSKLSSSSELLTFLDTTNSSLRDIEVITTDITLQQINITTSLTDEENDFKTIDNPEDELKSILLEIPEYSEKIAKLIERIKSKDSEKYENAINAQNNTRLEMVTSVLNNSYEHQDKNAKHCKNTLQKELEIEKKKKAAIIICAYTKGYLVRRLMRTAKVQTLIQTIHDALICALDLQSSSVIDEADVELHKRLIQQVSAACHDFYNVFFTLSKSEQMDIIAIDRDKKIKSMMLRSTKSFIDFGPKNNTTPLLRLIKSSTSI